MIYSFSKSIARKPEGAIFFGDWHGNLTFAVAALERAIEKFPDISVYYHVGDFGLWPDGDTYVTTIVSMMQASGKTLVVTGGNHEDWDQWDKLTKNQTIPYTYKSGGLVLLPKYYTWTHGGVKFASVGGAGSIDRAWRVPHRSWWPQEIIHETTILDLEASEGSTADVLITHEASDDPVLPVRQILGDKFTQMRWPQDDIVVSAQQRKLVSRALEVIKPKLHFHGHWHEPWVRNRADLVTVSLGADFASYAENAHVIEDFTNLKQ